MTRSAEELRASAIKLLEENKGKFFSSSSLARLLDEDAERIRALLVANRPDHVLARPGGGGGFIVPNTAVIDPFENFTFGMRKILHYLKHHLNTYCSRYEIARDVSMTPESVRVTIIRNRSKLPEGWKIESRVGQYGGYRLVRTTNDPE